MYLLFPGRHLCNTAFQQKYLWENLGKKDEIVFAMTSSNQENSRYNPVPFYERSIQVDRFVEQYRQKGHKCHILGIPHYGPTKKFAEFTIKEVQEQIKLKLNPTNTVVLCSTVAVMKMYKKLGYKILTAELGKKIPLPVDIIKKVASVKWKTNKWVKENLAEATYQTWQDYPDIPRRISHIYKEPLLSETGTLTERQYSTYAYGMGHSEIIQLKYNDVKRFLRPGKIVDEGCADGALLVPIAKDYADSDLIGIDISAEFIARCKERQRAGDYGGTYVHFHQRNLLKPIFEKNSINTVLCNSTLHELWSYAKQKTSVTKYLKLKYDQLKPRGRIIIRDVVGPEDKNKKVYLWVNNKDGKEKGKLKELSTEARLISFFTY